MGLLDGKVVPVTGAGGGIGRAAAPDMTRAGVRPEAARHAAASNPMRWIGEPEEVAAIAAWPLPVLSLARQGQSPECLDAGHGLSLVEAIARRRREGAQ